MPPLSVTSPTAWGQPRPDRTVLAHTVDHPTAEFLYPRENLRPDIGPDIDQHPSCVVAFGPSDVLCWPFGWYICGLELHRQLVVGDAGGDLVVLNHFSRMEKPGVDLALNGGAVRLLPHE